MRSPKITIVLFILACSTAPLRAQHMEISPKESRPSALGPAETFRVHRSSTQNCSPFRLRNTTRHRLGEGGSRDR
jgi:hypothetical protein